MGKWTRKGDFPGGNDGPWSRQAIADYLAAAGSPKAPGAEQSNAESAAVTKIIGTSRALIAREQARRLKYDNDEREGILVRRDDAEQEIAEMLLRIKERLEAIPDELLMELPAKQRHELKGRVENKIRLILQEMAAWAENEQPAKPSENEKNGIRKR